MINCLRHPIRERFLAKAVLGSELLLWLFWLPVRLRIQTIPILLKRLALSEAHVKKAPIELREAIGIVTRVCNLRVFRSRVFPKLCLRQPLTLYQTLNRMGYPVEIHFGVRKDDKNLQGHSWVTMRGEPMADTAPDGQFKVVYSYPSNFSLVASSGRRETERSKKETMFNPLGSIPRRLLLSATLRLRPQARPLEGRETRRNCDWTL